MKKEWTECKNILCIRLDNMGDLLMSTPAMRGLKETLQCNITVLTSSMAGELAKYIPCIDNIITCDVPWIKTENNKKEGEYFNLVEILKKQKFDAAVIFTVFSQNPMPAIMLTYLAGIPLRLAYCRENPYSLLTNWVPEQEPYRLIRHQVIRDLELVATIGVRTKDQELCLKVPNNAYSGMIQKIRAANVNMNRPWIIVHPGVSEIKRQFPRERFSAILKEITEELNIQVILTGTEKEKELCNELSEGLNNNIFSFAGMLNIEEFMALVDIAPLVLSVNTGTVHIAAALNTPIIVLYALTNPQHTPGK